MSIKQKMKLVLFNETSLGLREDTTIIPPFGAYTPAVRRTSSQFFSGLCDKKSFKDIYGRLIDFLTLI